jgi:predicted DNA-binding WGR domain protein
MVNLIVLERCDRSCNMARFYVLRVDENLFGEYSLTREWGRIGRRGRLASSFHANKGEARTALGEWLRVKRRRGYAVTFDAAWDDHVELSERPKPALKRPQGP